MRYTTFRFALDPTPTQEAMLARHAGASRFAYNECLRFITDALGAKRLDPSVEEAGRVFVVSADGTVTKQVTGLAWRHTVSAQVFEEAAADLGHALSAYSSGKQGTRAGRRVGFPGRKRKGRCRDSFRLRNKQQQGSYLLRVGEGHPRSVTLPKIGKVKVYDDTRSIRRLLRHKSQDDPTPRAKILFATIARRGSRWYVALNVRAPDFHGARCHWPRPEHGDVRFIGVDRGLVAFVVAARSDGTEVGRWPPNDPLRRRLRQLRRRSRALSRTRYGSCNRSKAARRLACEHAHIADARRTFLHEVSSQLVKNHARLAIEDLAVDNLVRNNRLARAIGDAAWSELARQVAYKAGWFGTDLVVCDRWYASSRICSRCGIENVRMTLAERTFHCSACELLIDRDRNAAANLAAWAEHARAPDR